MIKLIAGGDQLRAGIRFFDQQRQQNSSDASGILATDGCRELIWYSRGATKVLRNILCPTAPLDAVICDFAGSVGTQNSAIAILLNPDLLQLHLLNGETFDIQLPFPMIKMFPSSSGLILQRKSSTAEFRAVLPVNVNSEFGSIWTGVNRDDKFDVKLWLEETENTNSLQFPVFPTEIQSPLFTEKNGDMIFSPQLSVADSLEHYIESAVGFGPSPFLFSLAHPTAPVRPIKTVLDVSLHGYQHLEYAVERQATDSQDARATVNSSLPFCHISNPNRRSNTAAFSLHPPPLDVSSFPAEHPQNSSEQILLAVEGNLVCTIQRDTKNIVLWYIEHNSNNSDQNEALLFTRESDDNGLQLLNSSGTSQATSTTIANTSVLEGRHLTQREAASSSPLSFLSLTATTNTRLSQGSQHSRTDGMGNSTLSLNVSNNSGASSAEGMITSALMPYESQSGPTISLERQLKASRRGAALGHSNGLGSMKSSSAGATRYGGLNSTSSTLYSFTTSPPSGEQPVPARQSIRLANQRRAAALLNMVPSAPTVTSPMELSSSTNSRITMTSSQVPSGHQSLMGESIDISLADQSVDASAISTDALHVRDSSRNESPPQRRPIHRTNWEDGYIEEEDASVTLSSDTRMTALVSLDLRTLSNAWKDALSAVSDIVSLLAVTFSGGEELLGQLQIHFLLPSFGLHAHFQVLSPPKDLPNVTATRTTLRCLDLVNPVKSTVTDISGPKQNISSVAHMQIPLSRGDLCAGISTSSRSLMIPVTFLMHPHDEVCSAVPKGEERGLEKGKEVQRARSDYTETTDGEKGSEEGQNKSKGSSGSAYVSILIGGHRINRKKPLVWTDDFEGFELTPQSQSHSPSRSSSQSPSQHSSTHPAPLSLHSLGRNRGRMLCVTAASSSDPGSEDSRILTGPVCLFRGEGVGGVNGIVAEAICRSLKYSRLAANIGDTYKSIPNSRNVLGTNRERDRECRTVGHVDTSVVMAEIIAFMLLVQEEIGAALVVHLLLSTAFGMPLKDSLRTAAHAHALSEGSREDLLAGADTISRLCSCMVYPSDKASQATGCNKVAVRTAIFDIIHSVLQDLLVCGKGVVGREGQGVRILCHALHSITSNISNSMSNHMHAQSSSSTPSAFSPTDATNQSTDTAKIYTVYYRTLLVDLEPLEPSPLDAHVTYSTVPDGMCCFTGSGNIPLALDWVLSCLQCITAQRIDVPHFYTFNSTLEGDLERDEKHDESKEDVDCDAFPAIAFNRTFFTQLSSTHYHMHSNGTSTGHSSPPTWLMLVADAFVRASGNDLSSIRYLPPPLRTFVELALHQCKEAPFFLPSPLESMNCPPLLWPPAVLTMIGRNDLCAHLKALSTPDKHSGGQSRLRGAGDTDIQSVVKREEPASLDGLHEVEEEACRLRFADDDRVHEVCRLLRSSGGVYLRLEKSPEVSDLDHRHKLQMRLLVLCRRSLACPIGRGALTLGSLTPLMAEALPCPPLTLSGRIPPNNTPLLLHTATAPADLSLWPGFHNGVAAGLRVSSPQELDPGSTLGSPTSSSSRKNNKHRSTGSSTVTRNWIVYNRTASGDDSSFHAGVLLALGLQGHLRVLSVTDICDYLTQGNQPTTIALLIGLPASRLGTADPLLSKTLCLHVPSLLPPQHWDIEILPQVQTAALVGLGLVYCKSGHRLMTEFLLAELGRSPTADRDRGDCREAVSFAAAWALGAVLLGKGQAKGSSGAFSLERNAVGGLGGLTDLCIEDRLYQHLEGGKRPPDSHLFPHVGAPMGDGLGANGRSSRVLEGDQLNTGVTGPGAAIALGLIYIRSGSDEICRRLSQPQTAFALDSIRPDLLLYRAVARCLVLWDAVEPTAEWIDKQIPDAVTRSLFPTPITEKKNPISRRDTRGKVDLDPRSALSVYLNIITGNCWGIGLVFAGTADERAKTTLLDKLKMLQGFRDNKMPFPLPFTPNVKTLRPLIESCIGSASLALSCVMAGTGDLCCLRILRSLRWKVDDVTYGTHMSLAMAIGILFLSGGSASLRRDPTSCACLLLATAPRFPIRTVDNQYHLQALRHLYVLAVETRALQIVDADQGSAVSVEIEVELVSGERLLRRAPCLLPELITVRAVHLSPATTAMYYPASLVITPMISGDSPSGSRIPHPLYVKKRPSIPLPFRTNTSNDSISITPSTKSDAFDSLLDALRGSLLGDRMVGRRSLGIEGGRVGDGGRVEAQLNLDYLLSSSAASFEVTEREAVTHCSDVKGECKGSVPVPHTLSSCFATMSDISLAISTVGPLTNEVFLQAMKESISISLQK